MGACGGEVTLGEVMGVTEKSCDIFFLYRISGSGVPDFTAKLNQGLLRINKLPLKPFR